MCTSLKWDTDSSRGYNVEVVRIGRFEAVLTCAGEYTVGAKVWVATFAGDIVAVSPTRECAIDTLKREALRMLKDASACLEPIR